MKNVIGALGLLLLAVAWGPASPADEVVLLISGDTHGYLSPCGCTKPMTGGIRRRATAIRNLSKGKKAVILENGNLVHGEGRQDELKAETLAEALRDMNVTAINLGRHDAALGPGLLLSVQRLSGDKIISGSIAKSPTFEVPEFTISNGLIIGGASTKPDELARKLHEHPIEVEQTVAALEREALSSGLAPVLLLDGDEAEARNIAINHQNLTLIAHTSSGDPALNPLRIGKTWLVSSGEKGKSIIKITMANGKPTAYSAIKLQPEFGDDKAVSSLYRSYLDRVRDEGLLDKLPRSPSAGYAGSGSCKSCHALAYNTWKASKHYSALNTLEADNHDRDPDCVSCHVVGLQFNDGFKSRSKTPSFAQVGCESCHGPSAAHVAAPTKSKSLGTAKNACTDCHNVNHSPTFDFQKYWPKIRH